MSEKSTKTEEPCTINAAFTIRGPLNKVKEIAKEFETFMDELLEMGIHISGYRSDISNPNTAKFFASEARQFEESGKSIAVRQGKSEEDKK